MSNADETSGWACCLFGARTPDEGICWRPPRGSVPNAFQRWCMRVFLACRWVREPEAVTAAAHEEDAHVD